MGMNKSAMMRMARELMDQHGLTEACGWELVTNRSRRNAGTAQLGRITLSVPILVEGEATEEDVRNTILHEIAHCLVGPGHKHDAVWREKCIEIGGNGRETHSIKTPHRYRGTCTCGKTFHRDAKSDRMHRLICRKCLGAISWYDTVNRVTLTAPKSHPVYTLAASAPAPQKMQTASATALCTKCFTLRAVNGACNC